MASVLVRGLTDEVKQRLAEQASANGRSMEAELRDILTRAASRPNIGVALLQAAQSVDAGEALEFPSRSDVARRVDFT